MGPAINGTAIRDATGQVDFGDFVNQLAYQDAAVQLNNQVKKRVLANVDATELRGKKVSVVGAFQLSNPQAYLLTPVKIEVGR